MYHNINIRFYRISKKNNSKNYNNIKFNNRIKTKRITKTHILKNKKLYRYLRMII